MADGINLAINEKTPQYKQALEATSHYEAYHKLESKLRTIPYVEYNHLKNYKGDGTIASRKKFLDNKLKTEAKGKPWYNYVKGNFDKYFGLKSEVDELKKALSRLKIKMIEASQPKIHEYELIRN